MLARQSAQGWGAKVIDRLAQDLRVAFPEMKGWPNTSCWTPCRPKLQTSLPSIAQIERELAGGGASGDDESP